jgi:hypothetical protein
MSSRSRRRLAGLAAVLTVSGIALLAGCRPQRASAGDGGQPPAAREATVFTDTALYRQLCAEADSGLTPDSRRCTPRDQSRLLVRPPAKRP